MVVGDIVYARFPIELDSSANKDTSLTIVIAALFPSANYLVIHTEFVFDKGSKTKAVVIIIAHQTN